MTDADAVVAAARELRDAADTFLNWKKVREHPHLDRFGVAKERSQARDRLRAAMQAMQRALEQGGEG